MSQFGHYSTTVQDSAGNAISGASVTIYREGATLSSSQSGTSPKTFTVADHGGISTGDTVFINTTTGTTYAVDSTTVTTITLSGFAGTLALNSGDRIVPSNSKPTIYQDDSGTTAASNPLTTTALGFAECWIALAANDTPQDFDVLISGSGVTSQLRREQAWPSPPTLGNIRWAHQYDSSTSQTDGIQEAVDSITDSSETNPYTVMLRPGVYQVDRSIDAGTQTGTVTLNAGNTAVVGVGTKFKSTQALTGTATFTFEGETVTGVGTLFLSELQAGDYIQRTTDTDDGAGTDHGGTFGRVLTIESNTSLTLEDDGPYGGYHGWAGTTGSGSIRFREWRVGDHIYGGVDSSSLASRINSITDDTNIVLSEGTRTVYAGTTQSGVAVKKQTNYRTGVNFIGTAAQSKDYISLAGMDRRTCQITRVRAAGSSTGMIQCCSNQNIENLTVISKLARIHWDSGDDDTSLKIDSVDFSGLGISTGIGVNSNSSKDALLILTNNYVKSGSFAIHGGAGTNAQYAPRLFIVGNAFADTGTVIGLDFRTNGAQQYFVHISGNIQPYYNVDPGAGAVDLQMPTTAANQPYIKVHTDGGLRFGNSNGASIVVTNDTADYYFNAIIYPQERTGYQNLSAVTSGDVSVYAPATGDFSTTTTADAQWPAVCCNQNDNTATANWFPRLCTGPFGACFVESAQAVTPGDTLVTSTTAKDAKVNNAQTDLTRIIGWAFNGKTAGARRLVIFRRNMTLAW